jgi:hypothetical protein
MSDEELQRLLEQNRQRYSAEATDGVSVPAPIKAPASTPALAAPELL